MVLVARARLRQLSQAMAEPRVLSFTLRCGQVGQRLIWPAKALEACECVTAFLAVGVTKREVQLCDIGVA